MKIAIIGAGLGGLTFGACAARDGQNPPHLTPVKNLIFVGQQSENGGGVPIVLGGAMQAYEKWRGTAG